MADLPSGDILTERLPYLVVEALLDQLDIFALKALRSVSHCTKGWIEQPEFLRKFSVVLNSETRLLQVLSPESQVGWSSFVFSKHFKCVCDNDIKKFLNKYGPDIRSLEFNWPQEKMKHELRILSSSPSLESLKSNQLYFGVMTISPEILMETLLDNWKKVKHFHVQRFRGGTESPLTEMEFFERVLLNCTELKTLTVPQFSYDYQPVQGFNYAESYSTHVICPLLNYIQRGSLQSITVPYYGLTSEMFFEVAQACRKTNTVLFNVRSTFLRNLNYDQLDILDIIGSLEGCTDTIIQAPLSNVQNICFVNPSFNIENHTYSLPLLPSLKNVEIDFKFSRKNQKSMELFVHRLAKIRRPTVKSLKITYQPGPTVVFPINISPLDLVGSFVNLRVLHIKDWEGSDEQFVSLWEKAPNIVELCLCNCKNLTDLGILGENPLKAAILKLQYLRRLRIINYFYVDQIDVNITELSFIHAFRHMRLKSFHFFDGNLLVTGRSIPLTAIEALWKGTLGTTVEDFILQETDLENCDVILKQQLNLHGTSKMGMGKREKKWKYSDHFFRNPLLGSKPSHAGSHNQPSNPNCSIV
ncbi:hypothetical protein Ocin01_06022 [Orchesella cincta]|uniref:F-box domain-containing protein n=1 Tax=Orchesella cincta TaxID=48709 RepID=A0A1D2N5V2_ORCCI|nr:hypothetical protein Ocin01_06022 [Orchesella cincta]